MKVACALSINVEPNQVISGTILINEIGISMDANKSSIL